MRTRFGCYRIFQEENSELSVPELLGDYLFADDEYCTVLRDATVDEEEGIPVLPPGYGYFSYLFQNI